MAKGPVGSCLLAGRRLYSEALTAYSEALTAYSEALTAYSEVLTAAWWSHRPLGHEVSRKLRIVPVSTYPCTLEHCTHEHR